MRLTIALSLACSCVDFAAHPFAQPYIAVVEYRVIANMDAGRPSEKSEKQSYTPPTPQDEKRPTSSGRPAMATIQDDDERLLARIGYKQASY